VGISLRDLFYEFYEWLLLLGDVGRSVSVETQSALSGT